MSPRKRKGSYGFFLKLIYKVIDVFPGLWSCKCSHSLSLGNEFLTLHFSKTTYEVIRTSALCKEPLDNDRFINILNPSNDSRFTSWSFFLCLQTKQNISMGEKYAMNSLTCLMIFYFLHFVFSPSDVIHTEDSNTWKPEWILSCLKGLNSWVALACLYLP